MKKIVIANLKMNFLSQQAAKDYVKAFSARAKKELPETVATVMCPPFVHLDTFSSLSKKYIALGAQDIFWEDEGAFTGEVSAPMIADAGAQFVIVGHSERRTVLGETDAMVGKKVSAAVRAGLAPVICIGDTQDDRETGKHFERVEEQLHASVAQCTKEDYANMVVTYEPVWAISTNRTADSPEISSDDILSMKVHIRKILTELCGRELAEHVPVLYGGSVSADNVRAVCHDPDMDGALVGGASLDPDTFMDLLKACA